MFPTLYSDADLAKIFQDDYDISYADGTVSKWFILKVSHRERLFCLSLVRKINYSEMVTHPHAFISIIAYHY